MGCRNGYFIFGNEDIKTIMKKISRWYDLEVKYHEDFTSVRLEVCFTAQKYSKSTILYGRCRESPFQN